MKDFFTGVWTTFRADMKIAWWVWWRMLIIITVLSLALIAAGIDPSQGYWMNGFIFLLTMALFFYKVTRRDKS